jgi:UDP-N-acetylmuramoylalanine--D-glutamate ligase
MPNKKKVLVLGMAKSGYEAAKFLVSKKYHVVLTDIDDKQVPKQVDELKLLGVELILGSQPDDLLDNTFKMLVKNPGIKNDHPYVELADNLNIPVINEIELAYKYFPGNITIIGVTGTNGKTTTTSIIYEILKPAFENVYLMGNIGYPVCSFVSKLKYGDIAVMEISDHQLCNMLNFKTNISVLTNLSAAHLDFHGSYETYKSVKKRIFNHHTKKDVAILNFDDGDVINLTSNIKSSKKYFSSHSVNKSGCSIIDNSIYYNNQKVIALDDIMMRGMHNYENIMAAIMVAKELNVEDRIIVAVLTNFRGVEHRLEYVKKVNNREFYNDSKSTNIKSTEMALSSFDKQVILLLGGLDRGHSFEDLRDYLGKVKLIVAYGETKFRIKDFADNCKISCEITDSLEAATKKAYDSSKEGDIILLSPACASWDQFKDFEVRGKMFKQYIEKL